MNGGIISYSTQKHTQLLKMYRLRFLQSILLLFILFFRSLSFCEESFATVLMYHRFDEPKYPSTNIDSKIFEEQMSLLKSQNYSVLPLSELVLFFEQSDP